MTEPCGSIVCVGLCCLDLVGKVNEFPAEDTDRSACIDWRLGGNAAHNAIVLAALESIPVYFAGSYPPSNSFSADFMNREFSKHSVNTSLCQAVSALACPISMVIVNTGNSSRTILHDRGEFPEFSIDSFRNLDFSGMNITWIHFEGRRNVAEIADILSHIRSLNQRSAASTASSGPAAAFRRIRTSVELEKCRPELTALLQNSDVVFLSKEFAQFHGAADKEAAVKMFLDRVDPGAIVICAWGEQGCAGAVNNCNHGNSAAAEPESNENVIISVAAAAPDGPVVDTLGAGDTFVAACLHGLRLGLTLLEVMRLAAGVAGAKCGRADGFDAVAEWAPAAAAAAETAAQSLA